MKEENKLKKLRRKVSAGEKAHKRRFLHFYGRREIERLDMKPIRSKSPS